jgi:hypothetical protein
MSEEKKLTTIKIDPSAAYWRAVIGLLCLLMFLIFDWAIALFLSGFCLGMAFVLKVWTSQYEIVLIKKKDAEGDDS